MIEYIVYSLLVYYDVLCMCVVSVCVCECMVGGEVVRGRSTLAL